MVGIWSSLFRKEKRILNGKNTIVGQGCKLGQLEQTLIQNTVKHLSWVFFLKQLTAFSCSLFSQKASSYYVFDIFLSEFFFTDTDDSQERKGGGHLCSSLPFSPLTNIQAFICSFTSEVTTTYFLIAPLVTTRLVVYLLLDEIYHLTVFVWYVKCFAIVFVFLLLLLVFPPTVSGTFELQIGIPNFKNLIVWWIEAVSSCKNWSKNWYLHLYKTKFDKQVHLQELTQTRLLKQVLVTSSRQDHMIN